MNKLDHVVTNNFKKNKYQNNEANNNEPTFDTNSFNLSSGTSYPVPVLNLSLLGRKKHKAMAVAGITCLWDSRYTDSIIKR